MRTFIFFCCFFITSSLFAQNFEAKEKSWGLSFGVPYASKKLPEGRTYLPYQLMGYLTLHNFAKKKKNNFWIYMEPQWVIVAYRPKHAFDMEFGINLGLKYEFDLGKRTLITAAIGSGPHVISVETTDQVRGYIFSDNMEVGIRQLFKNSDWEAHLKWRWRHISNANLQKPNDGIDTFMIIVGVAKRFIKAEIKG